MCEPSNEIDPGVVYTYSNTLSPFDASVVDVKIGNDFRFRPFFAGSGIIIDQTTNPGAITVTATNTPLSYTFSTLGGDATLVGSLVGTDFRFRGLSQGQNIAFDNSNPNFLQISSIPYTYSTITVTPPSVSVVATQLGNDFRFRPLIAGTGIAFDTTTTPNAITISSTAAADTYSTIPVASTTASVVAAKVGNDFRFRGFIPGAGISIDQVSTPNAITISSALYTYSDAAIGTSIRGTLVGTNFSFRTLIAGNNIAFDTTTTPGAIILNVPTPPVYSYATNIVPGSDADITAPAVGNQFRFKPLNAGTNVTIEETTLPGAITFNGPTYASNVVAGSDADITATQVGNQFRFKPLNAGNNVTIEETTLPGAITINAAANIYTYSSNVVAGADANITAAPVGNDFRFKPLNSGTNVTIEETTLPGAITFNGPTYASNVVAGSDADITATQVGNQFRFKPLNAGNNVTIDEVTLPGAITFSTPTPPTYSYSTNVVAGSDANITATQVGNDFRFKPLNSGVNVTIEETTLPGAITINGPTYASNVIIGSDADITATQIGNQFRFKPLNSGTNIVVEETTLPGAITFNGPTYSSNVVAGSDADITATQVGNDFRFKPLNAGSNITIDEVTLPGAITFSTPTPPVYTYSSNVVAGSDANITATQVGNDFRFKPLNAGTNITIEETTLPGAITINAATGSIVAKQPAILGGQFGITSNSSEINGLNCFNNYAGGSSQLSSVIAVGNQLYRNSTPANNNFTSSIFLGSFHQFTGATQIANSLIAAHNIGNSNTTMVNSCVIITPHAASFGLNYSGPITRSTIVSGGTINCNADPLYSTVMSSSGVVTPGQSNMVLSSNRFDGNINMGNGTGNTVIQSTGVGGALQYNWPSGINNTTVLHTGFTTSLPTASNQLLANHTSVYLPNLATPVENNNVYVMGYDTNSKLMRPCLGPDICRVTKRVGSTITGGTVTFDTSPISAANGVYNATAQDVNTLFTYSCTIASVVGNLVTVMVFRLARASGAAPGAANTIMATAPAGVTVNFTMTT
jgi:hypothetical protein